MNGHADWHSIQMSCYANSVEEASPVAVDVITVAIVIVRVSDALAVSATFAVASRWAVTPNWSRWPRNFA